MALGESRTELIGWLNDLLQLNYTKIEQVGTGRHASTKKKTKNKNVTKQISFAVIFI